MRNNRDIGIVVYGATGYTGRLVADYMNRQYGVDNEVSWAMAGRNLDKLMSIRDDLGIDPKIKLIAADMRDEASVKAMVGRTSAILTTVGPYQLYGSELVAACAAAGTDYLDLCGEPAWMKKMIDEHSLTAQSSGAPTHPQLDKRGANKVGVRATTMCATMWRPARCPYQRCASLAIPYHLSSIVNTRNMHHK